MRLRDLLAVPELKLRLEHGTDSALDRPIGRVMTTDLREPGRYLSGGELVMTGLVWRRRPADSDTFVADVARCEAIAIVAGQAVFGRIPEDFVQACRRHDVPLLAVPTEVSFATVTEYVLGAHNAAKGARLEASLSRQRQLLSAIAEGRGAGELVNDLQRRTGVRARVLSATGRQVVGDAPALPDSELDEAVRAFLTADRLPTAMPDGRSVVPVGSTLVSSRVESWFVLVDGSWPRLDAEAREAVEEIAALAAVDRTRELEAARAGRGIADDAVGLVENGRGGEPETAVRLRQAGLDPTGSLVVAVAGFVARPDLAESGRAILDDVAAHLGRPVVSVSADAQAVALLPASAGSLSAVAAVRDAVLRLAPGLDRLRLAVGVSDPSRPAALSGALSEARHARRLAELRPGAATVVAGAEVSSHVLLLATVPDDVRRTFASRVLGAVLAYDAEHDAGLIHTLEAFLDCSGSWSRTAEALHLHLNTVRYRIGRVEQLAGRDLSSLEDRVDVFLALRSR